MLRQCPPFHVLLVSSQKLRLDDARFGSSGDFELRSNRLQAVSDVPPATDSESDSGANALNRSDSDSPVSSRRKKSISGAASSVASTVFRHVIRRFRGEVTNSSTNGSKSDLSGMERAVVLLVAALVAMCIAIVLALSSYADTLQAYGSLVDTQGTMIRSARQCADAFRNAGAYNDGMK